VTRGEPRSVRSLQPQGRFLPLAWICPTVMLPRTPHHRGLLLTVLSEDRRARVEGPSEGRVSRVRATISRACLGRIRFERACVRRSPPRRPSDTRCHRCACLQRRMPLHADGPTKTLVPTSPREERRLPEGQDAFHRHDTRRNREGIAPSGPRAGSLAHAAHTFSPAWGKVLLMGIARVTVRSPADP